MKKIAMCLTALLWICHTTYAQIPKGSKILNGSLYAYGGKVGSNANFYVSPTIGLYSFIRENMALGFGSGFSLQTSRNTSSNTSTGLSLPLTFSLQKWYELPIKTPLYFVITPFVTERTGFQWGKNFNATSNSNIYNRTWQLQGSMGLSTSLFLPIHNKWMLGVSRNLLTLNLQKNYYATETPSQTYHTHSPLEFNFNLEAALTGWGIQCVYFLKK